MTDTQWPRFVVFTQASADKPHQYAGSVHAPDAEIALLNARDVFGRRPLCVSMWVVPADAIFIKTAEQIASAPEDSDQQKTPNESSEPYCVFLKLDHRGLHSYAGQVEASSPAAAFTTAHTVFSDQNPLVWWLFPDRLVTHTHPEDVDRMFQMADKARFYRDEGEYHSVAMLRKIKAQKEGAKSGGA